MERNKLNGLCAFITISFIGILSACGPSHKEEIATRLEDFARGLSLSEETKSVIDRDSDPRLIIAQGSILAAVARYNGEGKFKVWFMKRCGKPEEFVEGTPSMISRTVVVKTVERLPPSCEAR